MPIRLSAKWECVATGLLCVLLLAFALFSFYRPDPAKRISASISMLSLAQKALNDYGTEHGHLPDAAEGGRLPYILTTPVNTIEQHSRDIYGIPIEWLPIDPFDEDQLGVQRKVPLLNYRRLGETSEESGGTLHYIRYSTTTGIVFSIGPDNVMDIQSEDGPELEVLKSLSYDPSNGIQSEGDVWRPVGLAGVFYSTVNKEID